VLELAGDPRSVLIEVKELGWRPPQPPKADAAASTKQKYRHHCDQVAFLETQRMRGNFGFFARSAAEVYQQLSDLGFKALPVPGNALSGCSKRNSRSLEGTGLTGSPKPLKQRERVSI
jgi:hypothetical protein